MKHGETVKAWSTVAICTDEAKNRAQSATARNFLFMRNTSI